MHATQCLSDKEIEKYLQIINKSRSIDIQPQDFRDSMKEIGTKEIQKLREMNLYWCANEAKTLRPIGGIVKFKNKSITIKQDKNNGLDYNLVEVIGYDPRKGGRKIMFIIGRDHISNQLITYVLRQRGKHVNKFEIKLCRP